MKTQSPHETYDQCMRRDAKRELDRKQAEKKRIQVDSHRFRQIVQQMRVSKGLEVSHV